MLPPLAPPVPPPDAPLAPPDAPPVPPEAPDAPPLAPEAPPLDAPPLADPLDEPDVPPVAPAPCPDEPVVPEVPAPVVPPPVPLPLSLLPPPLFGRVLRPGTVDVPEFVLLGLLLRTQSARAVPVSPAHEALGVVFESLCKQSESAVPVNPAHAFDGLAVLVPVVADGDVVDIDEDVSAANAAPVAASDVAKMSEFSFHNFINPSET